MVTAARIMTIALAAGAALATAAGAHAQTSSQPFGAARPPINFTADAFTSFNAPTDQGHWNPQPTQKSLFWDQKGHWGLKLDLSQPAGRDMQLRDVQAGAYFHITPSLRVGGTVALGDAGAYDKTAIPQQQTQAPRVKLETSFKF
jgi:hypothetical protein